MSKAKKADRDQRQFWQMVLETYKSSGLSVRQFCQQEGLSEASLYSWRKKLSTPQKTDIYDGRTQGQFIKKWLLLDPIPIKGNGDLNAPSEQVLEKHLR
jgi:hypothetical protein